jgi:hypothetical protein
MPWQAQAIGQPVIKLFISPCTTEPTTAETFHLQLQPRRRNTPSTLSICGK